MTTRVKFIESSKSVNAEVFIESDELTDDEVLERSQQLFEKASAYSTKKTIQKMR